jgi:hypothetical protein
MKITWRLHTWPIFPPFWGTASLACDSLRIAKYNFNGKFAVTTFKSRFSRCLNCLESFTTADSTPKMADLGLWASYCGLAADTDIHFAHTYTQTNADESITSWRW